MPKREDMKFDPSRTRYLAGFGLPFVFSLGITTLFQSLDKLALNHYRSYTEVGIYASAMTFISLFGVVQSSFRVFHKQSLRLHPS